MSSSLLQRLKRYEIVRAIGEGGMGKVYLANDKLIRRPVAIKTFSLEHNSSSRPSKEKILRDFFLETRTAGQMLHPNIVVMYDVGKKGDLLYMVMEFVFGKTLLEHQRTQPFGMKKSIELIYELAMALDYAHDKGIIHRDIKPENIIISTHGAPKIMDFGIARFVNKLKGQRPSLVGSSRFMAPEQVLRREQDHRVDIYQLGVVLFELLTRQSPFKGVNSEDTLAKICTESPPPPGRINPQIPEELDGIVKKCLEKSPAKRFSRARDLAEALGDCLRSGMRAGISLDRELLNNLKKFEMFSLFTEEERLELVKAGSLVSFRAGEHIIQENEADSNFFVLLEGNVKVVKRTKVLTDFLPGACFGEIGAFARKKRSAGVIAAEHSKLLQINALLFKELNPLLQLKMLHIVLRNIASLVISLDDEIMHLTSGKGSSPGMHRVCPLCGFDNNAPIEVCPRCGVIPSSYGDFSSAPTVRDPEITVTLEGVETHDQETLTHTFPEENHTG